MSEGSHSFGPTCAYYESDSEVALTEGQRPPKVKAQFFYISTLPIDDPLSPLPPVTTEKSMKRPAQPFSIRDNASLEEAWQGFQKAEEEFKARPGSRGLHRMFSFPKFKSGVQQPEPIPGKAESSTAFATLSDAVPVTTYQPPRKKSSRSTSPTLTRRSSEKGSRVRNPPQVTTESQVLLNQDQDDGSSTTKIVDSKELVSEPSDLGIVRRHKYHSPFRNRRSQGKVGREDSPPDEASLARSDDPESHHWDSQTVLSESLPVSSMSGRPFARAPSTRQIQTSQMASIPDDGDDDDEVDDGNSLSSIRKMAKSGRPADKRQVFVPVGVSRLHLVELPDLTMKPIYWSPINDTSSVMRATWFYKDTMQPVPAEVANRLEIGYEDMKPYALSYKDELDACIEHGAAAELKIVHKLWPEEEKISRPGTGMADKLNEQDNEDSRIGQFPNAFENAAIDPNQGLKPRRLFESHSVIYVDGKNAQILRPNAIPSVSRNRKPLNGIRKGRQLGVAVVRGFDRQTWIKAHPNDKANSNAAHAKLGVHMPQSKSATTHDRRMSCHLCDNESKSPQVTDLVLVIHGIGQKLSERVDSFHFTHAINSLRREFNVELATESMKGSVREDAGVMVLPINWRLTLSFDDEAKPKNAGAENNYQLKDITPESLPALRSLISDVMLDIPYYLSHHKEKMTSAVIREANRVYRLWCRNNPGFQQNGKVHIIAHSLGSAMAMDILSQQPTRVPSGLDLAGLEPGEKMFEFDTTNLFCCGSPSGFFLLLNGANLVPRKGRNKPGMEGEDHGHGIAGEAGRYGCLAIDNLYNIMHRNDPIAYQQNACVDNDYAVLLQQATIPSATQSFLSRVGSSLRWNASTKAPDAYGSVVPTSRPHMQQMPSTVELETHNFTREEIAEKRMYLLNDNGQIDYFLNSGGGPLEIQYLNMLGAHSSYWVLQDFIRFLVVEIGREPGKENTLSMLRAVKKREYKRGNIV